jgi:hypothetical protein
MNYNKYSMNNDNIQHNDTIKDNINTTKTNEETVNK